MTNGDYYQLLKLLAPEWTVVGTVLAILFAEDDAATFAEIDPHVLARRYGATVRWRGAAPVLPRS